MNKEEILAMEAGRELDWFIAEDIFGHSVINQIEGYYWINDTFTTMPEYSTNISAAWEVIDKISGNGWSICINTVSERSGGFIRGTSKVGDWHCNVRGNEDKVNRVYAETAPLAICKAALLAVMDS